MSSHDGAGGGVGLWDKKVLLLLFLAGGLVFPFPLSFLLVGCLHWMLGVVIGLVWLGD